MTIHVYFSKVDVLGACCEREKKPKVENSHGFYWREKDRGKWIPIISIAVWHLLAFWISIRAQFFLFNWNHFSVVVMRLRIWVISSDYINGLLLFSFAKNGAFDENFISKEKCAVCVFIKNKVE